MNADIVVIGSLNMDMVVVSSRHPQIGETILGESFSTYPGGKGANQAIAAARLGGSVKMVGCVGQDAFGQSLLDNLSSNQVDISLVRRDKSDSTGIALITVDSVGKNTIIVVPGANHHITPHDLDEMEMAISTANLVILQIEIPLETVAYAIQLAGKHAIPVILNPAPAQPLSDDILAGVDYLIPNESELALLTGQPAVTLPEIRLAAAKILSKGVRRIILTRGDKGVYYLDKEEEIILPAYPVISVDTTAAGDAFIGGLAAAITRRENIRTALTIGSAAGALTVTKPGAQTSLPTHQELEGFLKNQK